MGTIRARLLCCIILSLLASDLTAVAVGATEDVEESREPVVDERTMDLMPSLFEQVDIDRMHTWVQNLTDFGTRFVFAENNTAAIDFLAGELEVMNLDYERQPFTYTYNNNTTIAENLIATIEGENGDKDSYYMVGAHFDSINHSCVYDPYPDWECPAPGADDNAVGVAAVLMAAEVLRHYRFEHTIKFALFNVEELPKAVGAYNYAGKAKADGHDIYGYLNLDMMAYNDEFSAQDVVYTGDTPDSYPLFEQYVEPINERHGIIDHLRPVEDPRAASSWGDNEAFTDYGYRVLSFVENYWPHWDNYKYYENNWNYHTGEDTIDKVNFTLLHQVTNLTVATLTAWGMPVLPDPTPVSLTPGTLLPLEGIPLEFSVDIKNNGNADIEGLRTGLFVDGYLVNDTFVDVKGYGNHITTLEWSPTPGLHDVMVAVNFDDRFLEWNVSNNQRSTVLFVHERPDVRIEALSVSTTSVETGGHIRVNVTVLNHGVQFVDCWLNFIEDGDVRGIKALSMYPNDTWNGERSWDIETNGTHEVGAMIGVCNPPDKDASNNVRTVTVESNGAPVGVLVPGSTGAGPFLTLETVQFDARSSFDDTGLAAYRYDFGDGTSSGWVSRSRTDHRYSDDGYYKVDLTVRDLHGTETKAPGMDVTIINRAPEPVILSNSPGTVQTGDNVTFDGSVSIDRDGSLVQWEWDLGEGANIMNRSSVSKTFGTPGIYTVQLKVTDDDGADATVQTVLRVVNTAPVAIMKVPFPIEMGKEAVFIGHRSFDANDEGSTLGFQWDMGDGTNYDVPNPGHIYSATGTFSVRLTVTDPNGAKDSTSMDINVEYPSADIGDDGRPEEVVGTRSLLLAAIGTIAVAISLINLVSGRSE